MSVRSLLSAFTLCLFCLTVCANAQAQTVTNAAGGAGALGAVREEVRVVGGLTTLYALDPLSNSLCFADGKDGHVFQENEAKNRCSDLYFGGYSAGGFSVGVEGGRVGVIIDLGDDAELEARYGYRETVGNGQGFASLHAEGGRLLVVKEVRPRTFQELKESGQLYAEGKSVAKAPVKVGHIYLVRLTDRHDRGFQRLAKLKVVSHVPGESVTIRWQLL
jgi:hypothetical protein